MTKRVLVPVAESCEDVELAGLTDVLTRGGNKITLASVTGNKIVTLSEGLKVVADVLIKDVSADDFDAVLLPGGKPGGANLGKSEELKKIMHKMRDQNKLFGAICHSPVHALGPLGMLEGVKEVSCYPPIASELPASVKYSKNAVVKSGNCLTSRGPDTALLFPLAAVTLLNSKEIAQEIAKGLLIDHCPEVDQALNMHETETKKGMKTETKRRR